MGTALPRALPAPLHEAPPSRLRKGTVSVVWAASAGSPGDTEGIVPLRREGGMCACVSVCMNVCACTQHIHSRGKTCLMVFCPLRARGRAAGLTHGGGRESPRAVAQLRYPTWRGE